MRRVVILALLLTVASTVLACGALFGFRIYRATEQARAAQVQAVAKMASVMLADAAYASSDRKAFVWSALTAREPALEAVLLLDQLGSVQYAAGDESLLRDARADALRGLDRFHRTLAPGDRTGDGRITISAFPVHEEPGILPGGVMIVALREADVDAIDARSVWRFFVTLLLVAATGMVLGFAVLGRYLLAPLRHLTDDMSQAARSGAACALPVDRNDELGRLARAFQEMQDGLDAWRTRATELERTMARRVDSQTKHINAELKRAERKAWTDPLTRLANRRCYEEKLPQLFSEHRMTGDDMAAVMVDIDHFKALNDALGHAAGDELLQFTGDLLRQCLRGHDLAIRLGGDEFLLLLPGASAEDAASVAQRTVRLFGQRARVLGARPMPSMSAGVASVLRTAAGSLQELVQCADDALYQAKHRGRDRVEVYAGAWAAVASH
jgi:diguanylate cyclase (GGDEF)-like protein